MVTTQVSLSEEHLEGHVLPRELLAGAINKARVKSVRGDLERFKAEEGVGDARRGEAREESWKTSRLFAVRFAYDVFTRGWWFLRARS